MTIRCLLTLFCLSGVYGQGLPLRQEPFTKESLIGQPSLPGLTGQAGGFSLLNPSRFSMRQSYTMSYVTDGRQGDMTGLYLSRMRYDFDMPLSLLVDVGLFHKPLALTGREDPRPGVKSALLTVPHAALVYQPSDKFRMALEYYQSPAGYGAAASPFLFDPAFPVSPAGRTPSLRDGP